MQETKACSTGKDANCTQENFQLNAGNEATTKGRWAKKFSSI